MATFLQFRKVDGQPRYGVLARRRRLSALLVIGQRNDRQPGGGKAAGLARPWARGITLRLAKWPAARSTVAGAELRYCTISYAAVACECACCVARPGPA